MLRLQTLSFLCLLLLATASQAGIGLVTPAVFQPAIVHIPEVNTEAQAEVGDSIIFKVISTRKPALKVLRPIESKVKLAFFTYPIRYQTGELIPLAGETKAGKLYSSKNSGIIEDTDSAPAIFIPNDSASPLQACSYTGGSNVALCDPDKSIKLEGYFEATQMDEVSKDNFRAELIYMGGNSKSISITYREFKNDFARPAFTQDLKYEIEEERVIGFKGARFEIIKASSVGLTYRVLRHLN